MSQAKMSSEAKQPFFVRPLPVILGLYLVLSLTYGLVTPAWEGYDEWHHFDFVCFLRQEKRLPTNAEKQVDPSRQLEQLPLYYVLGAVSTSWLDMGGCQAPALNWHFGKPGTGVNFVAHDPVQEGFPYQGELLALHVLRIYSTILGGFGVLGIYWMAKLVMPNRPRWAVLATALAAFQPQYIYLASMVSNDILAIVTVTGLTAASVNLLVNGLNRRGLAVWGLMLALTLGSKLNAISALPAVGLAILWAGISWLEQRGVTRRTIWLCLIGLCVALVAAFVAYLKVALDPSGRPELWLPSVGYFLTRFEDPASLRWDQVLPSLWHGYVTYWGSFGFGSIPLPQWLYTVIGLACLLAVCGWPGVWRAATNVQRKIYIVFVALIVVTVALPVGITLDKGFIYVVVGRYLLPAFGPVTILLTLGWIQIWKMLLGDKLRNAAKVIFSLPAVAILTLAILVPFSVILPAYAQPAQIQSLPQGMTPVDFRFGAGMHLTGYRIEGELRPGQPVTVQLCWQALQSMDVNYSVSVNLLGAQLARVSGLDAFPGGGNYPTTAWQTGAQFCDGYLMSIPPDVAEPTLARLTVAVYEFDGRNIVGYLPIFDGGGQPLSAAIFGRAKLYGSSSPAACATDADQPSFYFPDENIRLTVKHISLETDRVGAQLCWQAEAQPSRSYTIFVHLTPQGDPTQLLAQSDGEPNGGDYPTDLWEKGDQLSETRWLTLASPPTTKLSIEIGLYDPDSGERLVVTDSSEQPLPDNAIRLVVPGS